MINHLFLGKINFGAVLCASKDSNSYADFTLPVRTTLFFLQCLSLFSRSYKIYRNNLTVSASTA